MRMLRLAMAQMNPVVGDVAGNTRKMTAWIRKARRAKADVVVFPELAITGYPPEDLVLRPSFLQENRRGLETVIQSCQGIAVIVGFIDHETGTSGTRCEISSDSVGFRKNLQRSGSCG